PDFYRAQYWYADPYTPVFKDLDKHRIVGNGFRWSHRTMDSQSASAWVDHFFHTVDSSCWLPQNGFELWSVYYLRRHGMPLDRIKSYLHAFNNGIRFRLLHGEDAELDGELRRELIQQARSHAEPVTAPPPASRYESGQVRKGLEHWRSELTGPADLGIEWSQLHQPESDWRLLPQDVDGWKNETLSGAATAAARAVSRLRRGTQAALLAGELGPHPAATFPVHLSDLDTITAEDLAAEVARRVETGRSLAYTAESAAQFLVDRGEPARLPDTAVLLAESTEAELAETLAALSARVLAERVDVALVGLPDGRWRLAHRGVLSPDDADDLLTMLASGQDPVGVAAELAAPTFDL
ncbi:MAG: hypothetical protein ACRDXX_17065, partial [Stackebrandtia sp.]